MNNRRLLGLAIGFLASSTCRTQQTCDQNFDLCVTMDGGTYLYSCCGDIGDGKGYKCGKRGGQWNPDTMADIGFDPGMATDPYCKPDVCSASTGFNTTDGKFLNGCSFCGEAEGFQCDTAGGACCSVFGHCGGGTYCDEQTCAYGCDATQKPTPAPSRKPTSEPTPTPTKAAKKTEPPTVGPSTVPTPSPTVAGGLTVGQSSGSDGSSTNIAAIVCSSLGAVLLIVFGTVYAKRRRAVGKPLLCCGAVTAGAMHTARAARVAPKQRKTAPDSETDPVDSGDWGGSERGWRRQIGRRAGIRRMWSPQAART